ATGKTQKIEIKDSSGLEKDEIETMKREAESHADEEVGKTEETFAIVNFSQCSRLKTNEETFTRILVE
ncbi:MAG TPA: hypothetical protein EYQ69_06200, partial [Gemmatimonadetes bacterium]|nr:hypothetical protein [Gemmatimonadota bacterium]